MKELNGLKSPLSTNFQNSVTGALPTQDYDVNIQNLPDQKKSVYTYNFNNNFNPDNKFINIDLLNQGLTDLNNN